MAGEQDGGRRVEQGEVRRGVLLRRQGEEVHAHLQAGGYVYDPVSKKCVSADITDRLRILGVVMILWYDSGNATAAMLPGRSNPS